MTDCTQDRRSRSQCRRWGRYDVALAYTVILTLSTLTMFSQPHGLAGQVVLRSSTNLVNLRHQPLLVLGASAFVLSSPTELWAVLPLFAIFAAAQRWVGRWSTVLVAVIGHVFATVFTATLLAAGIARHQLSRSLARQPDVGVSYALAALLGLLLYRLPGRMRVVAGCVGTGLLVTVLVLSQTFTDLGHLIAWCTGLAVGQVGTQIAEATSPASTRTPGSVGAPAPYPAQPSGP